MGKVTYQIITTIKESNKGNVYLATMEDHGFPVIVKRLKHGNRDVFEALQAIQNEHLPQIYRVEETNDGLLVAEEYIEGELLTDYLTAKKFTESEYINIAKQLCAALRVLHEHIPPLIHRDIKPSNVIVNSKGVIKLIDFDSSRLYKAESDGDTRLLGTEKYAAPEQYGFSQTDSRSDIYSLGVVFGMFPEFASEAKKKRWKKLVERCTLFAPESRYQTVGEIERELQKIEKAGVTIRKKVGVALSVFLLLCGVCFAAVKLNKQGQDGREEEAALTMKPMQEAENGQMPASSPTPVPSPTPVLTATPVPTATPRPTTTPSPTVPPSPTVLPSPTAPPSPTLRATATPTPLQEPTPTLLPLELGENVVRHSFADYVNVKLSENRPEARVVEGDAPEIVVLKKTIAINNAYVQYYFKDRMQKDDLLTYVSFLDDARESFIGVKLYSYSTGEWMRLSCTEATEKDGICHIDGQFMDQLPDGFYHLVIQMRFEGDNGIREHSTYVYVADSDDFEEPVNYVENNCLEYRGEKGVVLHSIVRNSFDRRIESIQWEWGDDLDPSLYTILYGGRAVEYSSYLLEKFMETGELMLYLKMSDGTREQVLIRVVPNML